MEADQAKKLLDKLDQLIEVQKRTNTVLEKVADEIRGAAQTLVTRR